MIRNFSRLAAIAALLTLVAASSFAQEAADAAVMKRELTAVSLWQIEQRNANTLAQFEERGDKLWAKFDNQNRTPVREVEMTFGAEGMSWVGARGQRITVRHDPKDAQTPFKGTDDKGGYYNFKPR